MSKTNPNQDFYKIGGRAQSDGPDKNHANANDDKGELAHADDHAKHARHPAVMRAKKK